MFRIRRAQIDWFDDKTRRDFVAKISRWLADAYPECVANLSTRQRDGWVAACVIKAERYGVVMEPEVAQLLLVFLILGDDADERLGWVKDTLTNRDLVGVGKVRRLVEEARAQAIPGAESIVLEDSA
jgi:hypothetical protein